MRNKFQTFQKCSNTGKFQFLPLLREGTKEILEDKEFSNFAEGCAAPRRHLCDASLIRATGLQQRPRPISLGADRLVADGPGARRQRSDAVNRGRGASASRGARASPDAVSRGASAADA